MSKRIRISQITMEPEHSVDQVIRKAEKLAGVKHADVIRSKIIRQSVDARKKDHIVYSYVADLYLNDHAHYRSNAKNITLPRETAYQPECTGIQPYSDPIAVIGNGPAGLFCAYLLALHGYCPIVFERGKCVSERQKDVERFWATGELDPQSNVQFGEGGAGTFSDGKLNTLVKDKYGRNHFVLETFVRFGAPEDILYVNKPHIGTDILRTVVENMRNEILRLGGTFHFSSQVTDFRISSGRLNAIEINHDQWIPITAAVVAVGHSARDTFPVLYSHNVPMEAKSFAVGMRVEHPQNMINISQYGTQTDFRFLPTASYKLTHQASNGRGVYSFCMCPGGFVVNASSEENGLAVNGMSYRARDSHNANSAIIITVTPQDYDGEGPLAGISFQRELERRAWQIGNGKIPQQLFGDFERDQISHGYGEFESCHKGFQNFGNLRTLFPDSLNEAFIEGMHAFGRKINGFDRSDCILSGVESRTSSPVRILRGENLESEVKGLFPCGEGAGYAGGITSAAMDGLKVAEAIMSQYCPETK